MIKIDSREPDNIFRLAESLDIQFAKEALDIGDFVDLSKGICIERKALPDFIASVQSGHLQKQLLQMQENFPCCYLLISGSLDKLYLENPNFIGWTLEHHLGAIASVLVRYNVKVFNVPNDEQLLRLVAKICHKTQDGKVISWADTELLKSQLNTADIELKMLCCLPGISLNKGKAILTNFKLKDLYNTDIQNLTAVKGLGKVLAERIKSVFK